MYVIKVFVVYVDYFNANEKTSTDIISVLLYGSRNRFYEIDTASSAA